MKHAEIIDITAPNSNSATKPSSPRRVAASRANGAKSHGPATPAGKARSSKNAVTHGILADRTTLSDEDEARFKAMHEAYAARLQPRDAIEHDLVEEFAFCKFQMREAWVVEADTIHLQMAADNNDVEAEWSNVDDHHRKALAIAAHLENSKTIPLMQRYARTLSYQADRALNTLMKLRKQPLPTLDEPAETTEQNEPSPTSEHPETTLTTNHKPLITPPQLTTVNRQLATQFPVQSITSEPQLPISLDRNHKSQ